MATINVSSTAALNTALKAAKAGDTILLSTGTYTLNAAGLTFASDVTIASANVDRPAVITSMTIDETVGLTLRDLEMKAALATGNQFKVVDSRDIHFERVNMHGSVDGVSNDGYGLLIRGSRDVSVSNSEFHDLEYGVSHLNSNGLTIDGNTFHHLQVDGVRGGGSSNVTIKGNLFRDFFPNPKNHPDAIQFWTANTTASATNIVITDNAVVRGDGAAVQGIFLKDQVGNLPFEKVVISGNVLAGTTYHGIMVRHAHDVTITDNVVQGFTDKLSWIRVEDSDTGAIFDNRANQVIVEASRAVTATGWVFVETASARRPSWRRRALPRRAGPRSGAPARPPAP